MAKGTLLIIDDDELVLSLISKIFEGHIDKIYTTTEGNQAIDILQTEEIHCVICDIALPDISGVEIIKQVRINNNQVPFIFYTSHSDHQLMVEALKYGAFDFLIKPNLDGLKEIVIHGLEEGFSRTPTKKIDSSFISKYQKMLEKINS